MRAYLVLAAVVAAVLPARAGDAGRLPVRPGMYDGIEVRQPYVWPPPRRLTFGRETVPLVADDNRQAVIVTGARAGQKALLGAREVSARVAALNLLAVNLPIRRYGTLSAEQLRGSHAIIIGTRHDNPLVERLCARHRIPLGPAMPGAQGYVLRVLPWGDGRRAVLIGGTDDLGTLYGCYTFEQLLRGRGRSVSALAASIDDWPGFKHRPTGWGYEAYNEKNKEDVREYADLLARLRVTLTLGGGCAVPEVTRFAQARGLAMLDGYWSMQGFADYAAKNVHRNCVPGGSSANCWSDPGLSQRIAEHFGQTARTACGISHHDNTDAGWWTPYLQFWNQRCELCRRTYPEPDPRKADADRFNSVYQAVKAHGRDKLVVLTLPCYYDNPERFPQMIEYLEYLRARIPKDVIFLLEDRGAAECVSYEKHLGRECINYLYPGTGPSGRTWAEDFVRCRAMKGKVAGCWYAVGHRPDELLTMMAAAYAWNPDLPADLGTIYRVLVPQACHTLYGGAWREMAEVYLLNTDPRVAGETKDPTTLEDAAARARRAVVLLERAIPKAAGQPRITCQAMLSRCRGILATAEERLAFVRPLKALHDALALVRDNKLPQALALLGKTGDEVARTPDDYKRDAAAARRFRYLALDLRRLRERVRDQDLRLVPRQPLWQIGVFDNLTEEFAGAAGGKLAEFPVDAPPTRFPAGGGYTLLFEGALPEGGRLLLRVEGSPVSISLDGQEVYYTYDLAPGYNDVTVPLPPLPAGPYRIGVAPEGGLRTDAAALYPGQQLVPTTTANEWILDASGTWDFRLDPENVGEKQEWFRKPVDPKTWTTIAVPGYWESDPRFASYDGVAWYHTSVKLPWEYHTRPVHLRFGGADDRTKVWVAGAYIGKHDEKDSEFHWFDEPFEFDVSGKIPFGDGADIVVRVDDTHGQGGIHKPLKIAIIIGGKDTAAIVGPGALGF